jgi:hypothetical protein
MLAVGGLLADGRAVVYVSRNGEATNNQTARNHSWAVYHIKGTPAKFVGVIGEAPKTAIESGRPNCGSREPVWQNSALR